MPPLTDCDSTDCDSDYSEDDSNGDESNEGEQLMTVMNEAIKGNHTLKIMDATKDTQEAVERNVTSEDHA
jgi:hypothetical protein